MPHYNLEDIRNAARKGDVEYRGRKVRRDIDNLGYEFADVVACVVSLTSDDHYKTYIYDDGDIDDAYCVSFIPPGRSECDSIYIKLSLINSCLVVDIASFHLSG